MTNLVPVAPEGDLTRYLQEIRQFPMLTPEEETRLAVLWRDRMDVEAAHKLVTSHLRLVAKIARGYRGYGLPLGELIGEGNVGMMQAVQRFDPDRGFRLATYAMWWIRAAINEYVLRNWSLVRIGTTAAQKKLFFNLKRLKGRMQAFDNGDLQPEQVAQIARTLEVTPEEVVSMNRRLTSPDASLNVTVGEDQDSEWQDSLVDEHQPSPEATVAEQEEKGSRSALMVEGMKVLNDRERHILTERKLRDEPTTLEALAQHYGISRERVRQLEARAFEKLQKAMKAQIAARRTPRLSVSPDLRAAA
jgi:RNA polymerase sigma-32 factor